jgi:long-chain acyl-CoA synthetase
LNLASLVDAHPPDRRALCGTEGWSDWGEVRTKAGAVALGLSDLGIEPGDRVALAWPTAVEFVIGYLGVLAAGAVAIPLNPVSPAAELEREIEFVEPAAVICAAECAGPIATFAQRLLPTGRLITPARGGPAQEWTASSVDWESFFEGAAGDSLLSAAGSGSLLSAVDRADDDPAVMLFTSGTAGSPRVCVLTHGNLISNLRQMLAVPGRLLDEDDIGLAAVPFSHVFGLNVVLGLTFATGAALVCEERFEPGAALQLVQDREVTVVAGAPPMFADWADLPDGNAESFSKVRLLISGAAALSPEVASRFTSRFGLPIREGYGLTEASPAVSTSVGLPAPRHGSVGRPLPGVEIRLVDDSGEDALSDDPGEIWVRGPNVFHGYWRDPQATDEILDSDGWLHTGDVGVLDVAGELHVVDRLKDLIIVSGFNVIPAEVERVLLGIDGVTDAVVIGTPDNRTGETVEAVVVLAPGSDLTSDDIVTHASRHLAHYKVPTKVRFRDELPHGLAGKALRRAVRDSN